MIKIRKEHLSIIIILCTIISVSLMTYDFNLNREQEYTQKIDRDEKEVAEYRAPVVINNDDIKDEIEEGKDNWDNIEKDANANIVIKNNSSKKDIIDNEKETNDSEKDIINIQENSKEAEGTGDYEIKNSEYIDILNEKDVSVFKMDAEEILDELTLNEKKTLLSFGMKFSPIDYIKMKNYLYMSDREEGVSRALKLAEKRLTADDYKKMEDMIDEYIDVDAIEKKD